MLTDARTLIAQQRTPPTRFGEVYRDEIARADNVIAYPYANLEEISQGFKSLRQLVRSMWREEIPDHFWKPVGNAITDVDDVAIAMYHPSCYL